ncbi:ABC transporter permease [Microtetraspora sp. NBRC 13810]|uniref:ABC transporter permease n=1 Tax=Microtetraspora sp. NBRC 13810 TaxID=3030990 RepID=UPI0024A40450|nr:ABC transporter permease [Microtetraspora sp. NBRC 13810]GLW11540.1 ABC transporter permease [Microtetraspora sp. NBRC 13810]
MRQDTLRSHRVLREILGGNAVVSVLAIGLALLVGSILVVFTDPEVQAASGYLFARPADTVRAVGDAIGGACSALFQGAVFNGTRAGWANQIKPLTETLTVATPLIAAGLGVSVAFRAGMFNIGGRGQMLIAAAVAGWISWSFPMPHLLHMLVCVLGAMVGGALWGGLAGVLKARTGAHEVIVTIMLNYVAFYLVSFLLRTPGALQAPGSANPKSPAALDTAVMPTLSDLLGVGSFRLHAGFILVVAATILIWWVLNRSGVGFRFRVVGENPNAARVAGIDVKRVYLVAMMMSGGLIGLAGASQVLGTTTTGFGSGIDAGIGFDAITIALLGRSRPWGVFASGLMFGALKTGGYAMQAAQAVPIDLVLVVQSVIVLLIAAPPLVRAVFRLPAPAATTLPHRAPKAVNR